jgi:hypothetical protein
LRIHRGVEKERLEVRVISLLPGAAVKAVCRLRGGFMNWLKAIGLPALLLAVVASPLGAASYVQRINSGYSFGFTSFGSYSYPTSSYPSQTNTTLQTSSCLYNSCGGSAPGNNPTTPTTSLTSSFVPATTPPSYRYSYNYAFTNVVSRYSVFGVYTFRPGVFGATQQPVFGGGLQSTNVIDPLANPEPTSIAMFGAGLLALGWAARRRRMKT